MDIKQMLIITKEDKEEEILTDNGATVISIPVLKWILPENTDREGISATEKEFDFATKLNKNRLIFIGGKDNKNRDERETKLIKKAEQFIVRQKFISLLELKSAVYAALISYLEENEYIRTTPFDATFNRGATMEDIDEKSMHFHGTEVVKPIPSYQIYKGDLFQTIEQTVDFVLAKIDLHIGLREHSIPPKVLLSDILDSEEYNFFNL